MENFFYDSPINNYINFSFNKFINDIIKLKEDKNINNIIHINSHINLISYNQEKNTILLTYYIIYKILYSSMPNNITYTLKKKIIKYTEIIIPENFINMIINKKDFNLEVNLIDTNILTFNKNTLTICSNFIISLNIPPSHCLAYIVRLSDYEEYIYTSLNYGKSLTQKTFDINTHYSNIKFFNSHSLFCIIKNNKGIFLRKIFLNTYDFQDIYHNDGLKNFYILDTNNVLLVSHEKKDTLLLTFNLKTLHVNLFYKFNTKKLSLIKCCKNFIILMEKFNDSNCFILLNKETLFISKYFGKFIYMDALDIKLEGILMILLENNHIKLLNLNSKELIDFNNTLIEGEILNCKFITSQEILLHEKYNNKELLSIINLLTFQKKVILKTSFSIGHIYINVKENIIYLSLKENNRFNFYCIDKTETLKNIFNIDAMDINFTYT